MVLPNHLRGVLSLIYGACELDPDDCAWLSYAGLASKLASSRSRLGTMSVRQVKTNVARLKALGLVDVEARRHPERRDLLMFRITTRGKFA